MPVGMSKAPSAVANIHDPADSPDLFRGRVEADVDLLHRFHRNLQCMDRPPRVIVPGEPRGALQIDQQPHFLLIFPSPTLDEEELGQLLGVVPEPVNDNGTLYGIN